MSTDILREAERLWRLGCGVLWLRPNSKAPVRKKWSQAARDSLEVLTKGYQKGYGLGVSMGRNSRLTDGCFLANIDVDVKGKDERYWAEALAAVESRFPGISARAPRVKTSFGMRFFVKTKEPAESGKITASGETCIVCLPSTPTSGTQQAQLTAAELAEGFRVRVAWEVDFMSEGRQVVVPPTLHPDTGEAYTWVHPFTAAADLPLVEAEGVKRGRGRPAGSTVVQNFEPVEVDLSRLPWDVAHVIETGEDPIAGPIVDRSAAIMSVVHAMVARGYTDMEIMSVLTDELYALSDAALERRGSRGGAAAWIRDYTIKKVRDERSAERAFAEEVEVGEPLADDEADEQTRELTEGRHWTARLKRGGKYGDGAVLPSIANTVLVLENAVAPDLFKRNVFALRDFYGVKAPWFGGDAGKAVTDDDVIAVREWLHTHHGFEPSKQTASDAVTMVAVKNSFHPIIDELIALPAWDGVERIDRWLARHFGAKGDREYLAQVFRKWLVASVKRVFEPGAKFDWLPIFQGAQGTGKSSFGKILFGDAYFNDWLPALHDKDAALGLQGIRCQEFSELESMRKNELETTKAFVTRTVDKVRPPYGQRWLEIARQCVFFGTTNHGAYLRDDTGNRRFMPVEVGRLDFERLTGERDQLWAEALFIYDNGLEPSLYLDGAAATHAVDAQTAKIVRDEAHLMADALYEAIENGVDGQKFDAEKFKMVDLFLSPFAPLSNWRWDSRAEQFAGRALRLFSSEHGTKYKVEHRKSGTKWWSITPIRDR